MSGPSIVWFRNDLRLADNPALQTAVRRGEPIVPLFIFAPEEEKPFAPGAASRWWLHHSLERLSEDLARCGSELIVRRGPTAQALTALIKETGARAVFWNRRCEPAVVHRDKAVADALQRAGVEWRAFDGSLLFAPDAISNLSGKPYQVFTQFWRTCLKQPEPALPSPAPRKLKAIKPRLRSVPVRELKLLPVIDWAAGLRENWRPGSAGARRSLDAFRSEVLAGYATSRDLPGARGTSRLSPHLHFGEISPRQVWHAIRSATLETSRGASKVRGEETFLKELGWREFAHHLLWHFPHTQTQPLRENFKRFPWRRDANALQAWQRGRTGYPIVDAGMRELWTTGWMHNRVRMIVASFLVKDLQLSWRDGAAWFWDTLVDADLANNTLGWQWSAGCGADAAPYFRIFNPVAQGERFDARGTYVRRWVPELSALPDKFLHRPWEAPAEILAHANVKLGAHYPWPIVDHAQAREAALTAFEAVRR